MNILDYLATDKTAFLSTVFVFGLFIGSFLNVVIYRYPVMFKRGFYHDANAFLTEQGYTVSGGTKLNQEPFNIVVPRSRCPSCGHAISAIENVPILSWLFLKGRCKSCQAKISIRYPSIELLSAISFVTIAYYFGFTWLTLALLFVTASLIALIFIDIDTMYLPDTLVFPILWLGLLVSTENLIIDTSASIYGVLLGYLSLWSVYWLFKLLTKKEGMGYGDFKLLAAIGAWVGWQKVLLVILLSSFVGAAIGIALMVFEGKNGDTKIPFGPYLAIAGWIAIIWGDGLVQLYLNYSGLN